MANRTRAIAIGLCMGLGLLGVLAGVYYNHTREAEGRAATCEGLKARDILPALREGLPEEATNIWYSCHFYHGYGEAVFDIREQEFLAWAAKRGWNVKAITPSERHLFFFERRHPKAMIRVSDGYAADGAQGQDLTEHAAYDRETGKAYYEVSLR